MMKLPCIYQHLPTPSKKRVREAYHAQRNRADQAERELNAAQKKLRQMKKILKARQFREVEVSQGSLSHLPWPFCARYIHVCS